MQLSPLGQQLIELIKSDYPDDYARACRLARAIEGQSVSSEEAMRLRLRVYRRYDIAAFGSGTEVGDFNKLLKKFVEHFADVYRHQMVGRIKGSLETKTLEPALIRPEALRFDPDELVLDKGELIIVGVRVEAAPAQPPSPLSGKEWVPVAFERRRDELAAMPNITEAARGKARLLPILPSGRCP